MLTYIKNYNWMLKASVQKILQPPPNSRRLAGDMKQVPYLGPTFEGHLYLALRALCTCTVTNFCMQVK